MSGRIVKEGVIGPSGTFFGLGGARESHDAPLADLNEFRPSACWYEDSGRTIAPPQLLGADT